MQADRNVQFDTTVKQWQSEMFDQYKSYAYGAGYLESMIKSMFRELPKRKQELYLRQIEIGLESVQKQI